jgi:hypothetical protein
MWRSWILSILEFYTRTITAVFISAVFAIAVELLRMAGAFNTHVLNRMFIVYPVAICLTVAYDTIVMLLRRR